ncbi:MAG: SGNH/GDSL hydrolase family protein [Kiritimatiellales bacterium]|nr:SGNH/GDSL hydrolase family protein [Kiritimatiellales bacterium]
MNTTRRRLNKLAIIFALGAAVLAGAAEFKKPVTSIDLQDGDTLVFLGDSITHQCLYTQYVEDYYYTRYPERRIVFHNAGVSGDKAADALDRFAEDVAPFKPKYITVLLGMNDGSYQHFNHDIFAAYETGMTELADRMEALGAIPVFMGPTMYDARVAAAKPPRWLKDQEQIVQATRYYNALLAFYGTWTRDTAVARGAGYVDMLGPLNYHTTQLRLENPEFTLISDAVHPGPDGHAVMAFELLEQMNAGRSVSAVTANLKADGGWRVASPDGEVADVSGNKGTLRFSFKAGALPWVLPPEAGLGYVITKAGHKMSNERIAVRGLKPGKYMLKIDGVEVGQYSNLQLGSKVELQSNEKTPQYQQALAVALLNKERNEKAVNPLRKQWQRRKGIRRKNLQETDPAAYKQFYEKFEAEVARLLKDKAQYEDRIRQLAQPKARIYEISPAPAKTKP